MAAGRAREEGITSGPEAPQETREGVTGAPVGVPAIVVNLDGGVRTEPRTGRRPATIGTNEGVISRRSQQVDDRDGA